LFVQICTSTTVSQQQFLIGMRKKLKKLLTSA
jgi:hypothetical protein